MGLIARVVILLPDRGRDLQRDGSPHRPADAMAGVSFLITIALFRFHLCKTYFASQCIECLHVTETACAAPFLSLHFSPLPAAVPQSHILISCLSGHLACIGIGKEGKWPIVIAILAKLLACLGPYVKSDLALVAQA